MIRIKVTHGASPATYHFWNGFTPPKETPSGWGPLIADTVPIQTMTSSDYDNIFKPAADAMFTADAEDLAAFNT